MLLKTFCLKRFDKTIVTKTGSGRPLVNSYNLCTATTCKSVVFPESRYFNAVRFKLTKATIVTEILDRKRQIDDYLEKARTQGINTADRRHDLAVEIKLLESLLIKCL